MLHLILTRSSTNKCKVTCIIYYIFDNSNTLSPNVYLPNHSSSLSFCLEFCVGLPLACLLSFTSLFKLIWHLEDYAWMLIVLALTRVSLGPTREQTIENNVEREDALVFLVYSKMMQTTRIFFQRDVCACGGA